MMDARMVTTLGALRMLVEALTEEDASSLAPRTRVAFDVANGRLAAQKEAMERIGLIDGGSYTVRLEERRRIWEELSRTWLARLRFEWDRAGAPPVDCGQILVGLGLRDAGLDAVDLNVIGWALAEGRWEVGMVFQCFGTMDGLRDATKEIGSGVAVPPVSEEAWAHFDHTGR